MRHESARRGVDFVVMLVSNPGIDVACDPEVHGESVAFASLIRSSRPTQAMARRKVSKQICGEVCWEFAAKTLRHCADAFQHAVSRANDRCAPAPRRTTPDRGESGRTDGLGGRVGNPARHRPHHRRETHGSRRRRTHSPTINPEPSMSSSIIVAGIDVGGSAKGFRALALRGGAYLDKYGFVRCFESCRVVP